MQKSNQAGLSQSLQYLQNQDLALFQNFEYSFFHNNLSILSQNYQYPVTSHHDHNLHAMQKANAILHLQGQACSLISSQVRVAYRTPSKDGQILLKFCLM